MPRETWATRWRRRLGPLALMVIVIASAARREPGQLFVGDVSMFALGILAGLAGVPTFVVRRLYRKPEPELVDLVARIAARAGVATPLVVVSRKTARNGFAMGFWGRGILGVTEGLLRDGDPDELRGTVAHEVAHIARAATLRIGAFFVAGMAGIAAAWSWLPWHLALPVSVGIHLSGLWFMRREEYAADRLGLELLGGSAEALSAGLERAAWERHLIDRLLSRHPTSEARKRELRRRRVELFMRGAL